jgi:hypothetical protein
VDAPDVGSQATAAIPRPQSKVNLVTTGLQLALTGGTLIGLAFALLVWRLAPSKPDLADALDRLSPDHLARRRAAEQAEARRGHEPSDLHTRLATRLGWWGLKNLPASLWTSTPRKDLAILQMSETRFYGEKVLFALLGLVLPPLMGTFFSLLGIPLPLVVPTLGSLATAAVFFFLPNYNAKDDARKARVEFNRALGAFIEFVAQERRSGSSARQSLTDAAAVGDSWVFRRITQELAGAEFAARAPWDVLHGLADELAVPDLDDLADIMQQSGEDGAQIYSNLRARATSLRSAMLSAEVGKANAIVERMYIPGSLVGVIFMAILLAPAVIRFQGGT